MLLVSARADRLLAVRNQSKPQAMVHNPVQAAVDGNDAGRNNTWGTATQTLWEMAAEVGVPIQTADEWRPSTNVRSQMPVA